MADFDDEKLTAQEEIRESGKTIVLSSKAMRTYNPETQRYVSNEKTSTTLSALSLPTTSSKAVGLDREFNVDGQVFKKTAYLMIAGLDLDFEPKQGDGVLMDGIDWIVYGVTPFKPNETGFAIYYDVAIRV